MKKILISAVAAGALLGNLSAFEVLKDGDKSLEIIGMAKGLVGYGYNFTKTTGSKAKTNASEFIYGIQGNSRIGLKASYGSVFGAAILGAGEKTFQDKDATGGFRNLYLGYDFGDMGQILAGKNELITSMGGFSSSIFDTESGLQGFGGTSTSTRRFQIAYSIAGLTVAVSENDVSDTNTLGNKSIPRFSVGYEYKADGLNARVAASYTNASRKNTANVAYFTAGAKYNLDEDSYVSGVLSYGLNSHLVGESKIVDPSLTRGYKNDGVSSNAKLDDTLSNTHLVGVALEYGVNLTDDLGFKLGGGYQYATKAKKAEAKEGKGILHAYSAFVQLPYSVGKGFSIIPQVGYLGTSTSNKTNGKTTNTDKGNVLAEVLFNLVF